MMLYTTTVLFFFTSALVFPYGSCIITVSADVNSPCESNQTECKLGCCPLAGGVCCEDGFECCEKGQTCIPYVGLCIGVSEVDGKPSLSSSKSVPVKSSVTDCPSGTTECQKDKCCRYPHAACCSDGKHCCPQGYSCDLVQMTCNPNNMRWSWSRLKSVVAAKRVEKSSVKPSPGHEPSPCPSFTKSCTTDKGLQSCCPSFMNCCVTKEEQPSCCLNSTSSGMESVIAAKRVEKSSVQPSPGHRHSPCPSSMKSCTTDKGLQSCCPSFMNCCVTKEEQPSCCLNSTSSLV